MRPKQWSSPLSPCAPWSSCTVLALLTREINQIMLAESTVLSKERSRVSPFIVYCVWRKHRGPAHWIRPNTKPLEVPGRPSFPKSRTIPINVNQSYVEGWGKPFPFMFHCIFMLWTGFLDDKSALLQNHNSLGKNCEISLLCVIVMLSEEKSKDQT